MRKKRLADIGSIVTLILTVALFVVALFEKGLTQELLLEAGVFLVSAKLVIGNFQNKLALDALEAKLQELIDATKKK